jgi:acetyl-CoA acetyltransferase
MSERLDPRLPIIVGTGQVMIRDASTEPLEPAELMAAALRRAETDSGGMGLLSGADQVLTVSELSWRYRNPALAVSDRIGASPRRLATSVVGGNLAGVMVARAAADIQAGVADVIAISGGEATRTRSRLRKAGVEPEWSTQPDSTEEPETIGDLRPLVNEIENARGVRLPVHWG